MMQPVTMATLIINDIIINIYDTSTQDIYISSILYRGMHNPELVLPL